MKIAPFFAVAAALLIIISARFIFADIPEEKTEAPSVYFCPIDNCSAYLAAILANATKSIDCAFYSFKSNDVAYAIKNSNATARLVLGTKSNLGIYYKIRKGVGLMHNKFCIVDSDTVVTGSFNPSEDERYKNNIVVLHSKFVAENYEAEFEELWNGIFGEGRKTKRPVVRSDNGIIETYFCPEDECKNQVERLLRGAKQSIYFIFFSFTDKEVAEMLIELHKKGIIVRGMLEDTQNTEWSSYGDMKNAGIDIQLDGTKSILHHKVFIIDNETVITGSYNPTKNGNERNDENLLILHNKDIALKYTEEFMRAKQS